MQKIVNSVNFGRASKLNQSDKKPPKPQQQVKQPLQKEQDESIEKLRSKQAMEGLFGKIEEPSSVITPSCSELLLVRQRSKSIMGGKMTQASG